MSGGAPGVFATQPYADRSRVRGDVPGSGCADGVLPEPQSVEGAVLAARLGRLRYALVDEVAMLARVQAKQGDVEPVHDADLKVMRAALRSLERVIQHLARP